MPLSCGSQARPHLDEVQVDIFPLQIGDRQHGLDAHLRHGPLLAPHAAAKIPPHLVSHEHHAPMQHTQKWSAPPMQAQAACKLPMAGHPYDPSARTQAGLVSQQTHVHVPGNLAHILEDSVVMHVCTSGSMSSLEKVKVCAILSRCSTDTLHARS